MVQQPIEDVYISNKFALYKYIFGKKRKEKNKRYVSCLHITINVVSEGRGGQYFFFSFLFKEQGSICIYATDVQKVPALLLETVKAGRGVMGRV